MDDVFFPDDVETTPEVETSTETLETPEQAETVEPTEVQQETVTEPTPALEQPKIKVKFNHEEKELGLDEAVPLVQKGMNYDKLQEKLNALQSDPRLSFVEQQAKMYNLTPEQYIEAVTKQQEQARLDELIQQNIPKEYAEEILANRQFREQQQAKEKQLQQEQKQQQEFMEFTEQYPDVKPEDIPQNVFEEAIKTGKSLVDVYARHEAKQLRERIKILEQNLSNKQKAPVGSVTAHGGAEPAAEDPFLEGFNAF